MNNSEMITLRERIDKEFLPFVRRPSRYIGGEVNQIKKDLSQCEICVGLCFPDVYEIGMSNTGMGIIYHILNGLDGIAAERVFAPWVDAEELMRQKGIELFSLESRAPLWSFDVVGFSLTNELCYTNVLNMLDLGGIEIHSSKRGEACPIIVGGGGMTNCCEPIADFFDIFVLGQGEEAVVELVELIRRHKRHGGSKDEILLEAARKFSWAYVPRFYEIGDTGQLCSLVDGVAVRRESAFVDDLDNAPVPLRPIVPFAEAVHERVSIEVMRGCPGRCAFCQASFCRRPIRYRSVDRMVEIAKAAYLATGFDTVSLLSLSTSEYPELERLVGELDEYFRDKHVGVSLPSLRVDKQLKLFPKLVNSVRKGGLTIAVEAADEGLRDLVNKPLKNTDLFEAVEAAYRAGWQKLKLYFMVGFAGESVEDIKKIVSLCAELGRLRKKIDGKVAQINAAVSWLVPKPHTPLGWFGQKSREYFNDARKIILEEKNRLGIRFVQFKFHDIERSILESTIGRGDRKLGAVIEAGWRGGARFDLWDECFDYKIWERAFAGCGMDVEKLAQKGFGRDNILPWEHLGGPEKIYIVGHLDKLNEKLAIYLASNSG